MLMSRHQDAGKNRNKKYNWQPTIEKTKHNRRSTVLTVQAHWVILFRLQGLSVDDGIHPWEVSHGARVEVAICNTQTQTQTHAQSSLHDLFPSEQ